MRRRLPACILLLAIGTACGLEAGGLGGSDGGEVRDRGGDDGGVEVQDAPAEREDVSPEDGAIEVEDGVEVREGAEFGEADVEPDGGDDAGSADAPPSCPPGQTWCGDGCVDTSSNAAHCGGCGRACPVPPHAIAFCAASACGAACEEGWADCNARPGDGCEAHLASSPEHCGDCGRACVAPANADPRCTAGTCDFACRRGFAALESRCAAFGGAYLRVECGGSVCRNPNPFTGDCSCPPGFTARTPFRIVNDCVSPSYVWADLNLCSAPDLGAGSDWGGAYQIHDSGVCAVGNPFTGLCNCPAGFAPILWRVETTDFHGSWVGLCWSPIASEITFAGAFEVGDVGSPCLAVNPETGGCSCPEGARRVDYRGVAAHGIPWGDWGTQMAICYR